MIKAWADLSGGVSKVLNNTVAIRRKFYIHLPILSAIEKDVVKILPNKKS